MAGGILIFELIFLFLLEKTNKKGYIYIYIVYIVYIYIF